MSPFDDDAAGNGSSRVTGSYADLSCVRPHLKLLAKLRSASLFSATAADAATVALEDAVGGTPVNSHLAPWQPRRRRARAGKV